MVVVPQGVLIKHSMVLSIIASMKAFLDDLSEGQQFLGPEDVYISFLPLAHIFDRSVV